MSGPGAAHQLTVTLPVWLSLVWEQVRGERDVRGNTSAGVSVSASKEPGPAEHQQEAGTWAQNSCDVGDRVAVA